jgi:hypothetical protein
MTKKDNNDYDDDIFFPHEKKTFMATITIKKIENND